MSIPTPDDTTVQAGAPNTPPQVPPTQTPQAPAPWNYGNYVVPYTVPYYGYTPQQVVEKEVNQMPLIALIVSLVSLPFLVTAPRTLDFPLFTGILSTAAVILGHISLANKPKSPEIARGNAMAVAALIVGYFLLSVTLVWAFMRYSM